MEQGYRVNCAREVYTNQGMNGIGLGKIAIISSKGYYSDHV